MISLSNEIDTLLISPASKAGAEIHSKVEVS